jgi:hypothetical protein
MRRRIGSGRVSRGRRGPGAEEPTCGNVEMQCNARNTIIVAATMKNGIGVNGGLPWRLPGEMKYFARGQSRWRFLLIL